MTVSMIFCQLVLYFLDSFHYYIHQNQRCGKEETEKE